MIIPMIGHLEGTITALREGYCILSAGGVGYKVAATRDALARCQPGGRVSLWTHLSVRETALDLYGFSTEHELGLFEKLLTVSGIGPKSALGILDLAPVNTLQTAIVSGNAAYLMSVSGIGKKTAEKIVLELKDKIDEDITAPEAAHGDHEALEAMQALGYSQAEAREALRKVPVTVTGSNDRIREALRIIGSR
jgi:holliday junction DNA helicase RuvA